MLKFLINIFIWWGSILIGVITAVQAILLIYTLIFIALLSDFFLFWIVYSDLHLNLIYVLCLAFSNNWQTNAKRWPLYLTDINSIDRRWPTSKSDCVDFFHKLLTYQKLKPFIKKIGTEAFKMVYKDFESLQSYGIEIDEILNIDLTMIHRN